MESKNLVICDREKEYAEAFARYITKREDLVLQVKTCSSLKHVLKVQEKEKIDYLFISAVYSPAEREKVSAGKVFVLTEESVAALEENETGVYKYQSGDELLAELIRRCSEDEQTGNTFLKTVRKKEARIIAVFSPVHRVGKTTYALRLGKKLGKEFHVLYLNLETYGGIGGHFEEGGQTLSDMLYYARQEKSNLGMILTTIVEHKGKLDCVLPVQVSEDIKSISGSEWLALMQKIMEQSIYEILILDLDESIRELYQILEVCSEIHMLTAPDEISNSKIRQFEEELILLGREDIRRKIIRRERKA